VYPDPRDMVIKFPNRSNHFVLVAILYLNELIFSGSWNKFQYYNFKMKIAETRFSPDAKYFQLIEKLVLCEDERFAFEGILFCNLSPETIFGNLLPVLKKVIDHTSIYSQAKSERDRERRKIRQPIRRRGYNDKGTLHPSWKWKPRAVNTTRSYSGFNLIHYTPPSDSGDWIDEDLFQIYIKELENAGYEAMLKTRRRKRKNEKQKERRRRRKKKREII